MRRGPSLGPRGLWRAPCRVHLPSRATPPPAGSRLLPICAFDQTNKPWLLIARQPRASACAAISKTSACGGMLSTTRHPLQSKVCSVECSLNLKRMGKPQKGQRGRGASMSIRLVVKSKALIDSKDELHQSSTVGRQCWGRECEKWRAIPRQNQVLRPVVGRWASRFVGAWL